MCDINIGDGDFLKLLRRISLIKGHLRLELTDFTSLIFELNELTWGNYRDLSFSAEMITAPIHVIKLCVAPERVDSCVNGDIV